jgi:autophagy-related protein 5
MKMSKDHTTALWDAVKDNDYQTFSRVNSILLNAPTPLKNVPVRIYIPSSPSAPTRDHSSATASFKILQVLLPAMIPSTRQPNTLGAALRSSLPSLFPGTQGSPLATVILHGAQVPLAAPLADLMREAAYPDGWLYLVVVV